MNKFQTLRKIFKNRLFLALFCLLYASPVATWANGIIVGNPFSSANPYGISPFHDWKTLESEHFRITFPAEFSKVAQRVANLYEEVHQHYVPLFRWEPKQKTLVVLLDNQDTANGLTSPLGRFGMVLWMTPPDSWQNINYYDDWLRFLIFHEYAHFINMDTTDGIYSWVRPIFLDLFLPNTLWPPWMLEGLAVYMETQYTSAGRGRNPEYEMILRAAVDEKVLNTRAFVTLDQVNGNNPYYPSGDTRYQFGYQLMNQVARQPKLGAVPGSVVGKDALGLLSYQSASDVPFFLNDSLNRVIQKDWYSIWSEWVRETETRMTKDIEKIRSQSITQFKWLTDRSRERSIEASGIAASPDGKWLAYTLVSADQRSGLYLRDLATQETRRLSDKLFGVGMQFTPDSQALVYSEYNRLDQYSSLSDLKVYELGKRLDYGLSVRLRAKDPDVSKDGKWVTFTRTELSRVDLVRAPLIKRGSENFQIGPVEVLVRSKLYDRIANPKFSGDGDKIYYSSHPHGKSEENLMEFDLKTRSERVLWSDGNYNRYPAVDSKGQLYFISNVSGVDNLYQYRSDRQTSKHTPKQSPKMVTNVIGGVRLPCFGSDFESKKVYLNHFSTSGWSLAVADLDDKVVQSELNPSLAQVSSPPAPALSEDSIPKTSNQTYREESYSVFPSLLPRGILPVATVDSKGIAIGAQTLGFDVLDLHRYTLGASYSTQIQSGNFYGLYSNRTLGPDLSFSGGYLATVTSADTYVTQFARQVFFTGSIAYPIVRTYSQWVPVLSFNVGRTFNYQADSARIASVSGGGPIVSSIDAVLNFSNQENSRLALISEGGRSAEVGARYYFLPDSPVWRIYLEDREYFRLAPHTVLSPSIAAEWTSAQSSVYPWANALLQGRSAGSVSSSIPGDGLSLLGVRGYPNSVYFGSGALRPSIDFRIPISRIFGGFGIQRIFFENLYAVAFAESSILWGGGALQVLPSVGGGLRLSSELFYVPVSWGVEYHHGFNRAIGGGPDLFFNFLVSGLSF